METVEVARIIGQLENAVTSLTDTWQRQDARACAAIVDMHRKIDEAIKDVINLTARVDALSRNVTIIEPSIKEFNDEKLRDEGAKKLGRWLWGILLTTAGGIGYALHEAIGIFMRPH